MKSVRIITIIAATMTLVACGNKDEQAQNAEQQTFVSNSNNKNADTRPGNRDWGDVSNLMKVDLPKGMSNRMVEYEAMTIYFNPSRHIPNCVIYELTATEVSQADGPKAERRYNYNFNADPQVSSSPEWWEYKNSDYDRGHMA
ncbi:MAG: DNA/RNA non-specific endonuclease, partial [Muribaculaceae bacterium]|nr:DNA/RNA non-specific endonuclease [Muribaculaceae bacterium]